MQIYVISLVNGGGNSLHELYPLGYLKCTQILTDEHLLDSVYFKIIWIFQWFNKMKQNTCTTQENASLKKKWSLNFQISN